MNLQISVVKLTPDWAAKLLERNTRNRRLSDAHVLRLSKEIAAGRWKLNGDAIRMNGDALIDGQHRCAAVIKTGVPIETFMVAGVDSSVFDTIDCGKRRSNADALTVEGEAHARTLAAAVTLVVHYERGRLQDKEKLPNAEIIAALHDHPGVRDSVFLWAANKTTLVQGSLFGAFHYLFCKQDAPAAHRFFSDLVNGVGLQVGDPVLVLRARLIENAGSKSKLSQSYMAILIIKAWNARREGRRVSQLKFRETGKNAESPPTIQ